jgi:hypothetical protein
MLLTLRGIAAFADEEVAAGAEATGAGKKNRQGS